MNSLRELGHGDATLDMVRGQEVRSCELRMGWNGVRVRGDHGRIADYHNCTQSTLISLFGHGS